MLIIFVKPYKPHPRGAMVEVQDEIAVDLINRGIARAVPSHRVERAVSDAQEDGRGVDLH